MVGSNDFLTQLLSPDGFFASRKDASDADASRSSKQIADMQARLTQKQADLQAKFAALESTMAQLQAQSNALASQIARLSPSSGG
jgi:flagellar hook-associated protein 2